MKFCIKTVSGQWQWSKPCKGAIAEPTSETREITLYSSNFYYNNSTYKKPSVEVQKAEWVADIYNQIYGSPELVWDFWEAGTYSKYLRGKVTFTVTINNWVVELNSAQDFLDLVEEIGEEIILEKSGNLLIYDGYIE